METMASPCFKDSEYALFPPEGRSYPSVTSIKHWYPQIRLPWLHHTQDTFDRALHFLAYYFVLTNF